MKLWTFGKKAAEESELLTDPRDGRTYKTVKIGNQVWMAENFCGEGWGDKHGDSCLYFWSHAKFSCVLPGWHLPTSREWRELIDALGGQAVAGGKMKAKTHWAAPNKGASNKSGFHALPGGIYDAMGGQVFGHTTRAGFWSANDGKVDSWAEFLALSNDQASAVIDSRQKVCMMSIRYIRDSL